MAQAAPLPENRGGASSPQECAVTYSREQIQEVLDQGCNSSNTCQPCINCKDDWREVARLMDAGHTYHCACRMVWGDGECECQRGA